MQPLYLSEDVIFTDAEGRAINESTVKERYEKREPNSIVVSGLCFIEHPLFNDAKENIAEDGRSTRVKFVVTTGNVNDIAIYHSLDANITQRDFLDGHEHLDASPEQIARVGQKLYQETPINKILLWDEELKKSYHY